MTLITATHYPAVRAALDVSLTVLVLPDATIALSIYHGAAEAEILARDPLAATRTGDELQHIQNAAVLLTAALLAPALPGYTAEDFSEYSYQRKTDWATRAAELRKRAEAELAAVLEPENPTTASKPTMFTTAPGTRGL